MEHTPLGQDHTFARVAFSQVLGLGGLPCSTQPQLFSVHVSLPFAVGGIHSCIVVPPMVEAIRPTVLVRVQVEVGLGEWVLILCGAFFGRDRGGKARA